MTPQHQPASTPNGNLDPGILDSEIALKGLLPPLINSAKVLGREEILEQARQVLEVVHPRDWEVADGLGAWDAADRSFTDAEYHNVYYRLIGPEGEVLTLNHYYPGVLTKDERGLENAGLSRYSASFHRMVLAPDLAEALFVEAETRFRQFGEDLTRKANIIAQSLPEKYADMAWKKERLGLRTSRLTAVQGDLEISLFEHRPSWLSLCAPVILNIQLHDPWARKQFEIDVLFGEDGAYFLDDSAYRVMRYGIRSQASELKRLFKEISRQL